MKTAVQSQVTSSLQISLPFAAPLFALGSMLAIAAGTGLAMMMG
jgi:hypothetical protein